MDAIELLDTRVSNGKLTGPAPDAATLRDILKGAFRAPDHALLRPWKVFEVRGEAREKLGDVFADALADSGETDDEKLERARRKPLRAPLVLVVAATPVEHPKVPELEQVLSAGAVAHGILLGAHARGFSAMWRTGELSHDPFVAAAFGLGEGDRIVAFVYVGTAAQEPPATIRPAVEDHLVRWDGPT
jgi:nitroreductase